jgi:uncharacterized UBP type Zn finger protein
VLPQYADGSGGNGAAMRHFESTGRKYPLVVKLGTQEAYPMWKSPLHTCHLTFKVTSCLAAGIAESQYADGSGGNGAAMRHFESTGRKYPLVVKLGTHMSWKFPTSHLSPHLPVFLLNR